MEAYSDCALKSVLKKHAVVMEKAKKRYEQESCSNIKVGKKTPNTYSPDKLMNWVRGIQDTCLDYDSLYVPVIEPLGAYATSFSKEKKIHKPVNGKHIESYDEFVASLKGYLGPTTPRQSKTPCRSWVNA